ncbi:hypothetical protein AVEN_257987-1, partial [Araneus ventricosus]
SLQYRHEEVLMQPGYTWQGNRISFMAEEIDNAFENDQVYIRYKHETVCVRKERIACKKPNIFKTGRHESVCVQVAQQCAGEETTIPLYEW